MNDYEAEDMESGGRGSIKGNTGTRRRARIAMKWIIVAFVVCAITIPLVVMFGNPADVNNSPSQTSTAAIKAEGEEGKGGGGDESVEDGGGRHDNTRNSPTPHTSSAHHNQKHQHQRHKQGKHHERNGAKASPPHGEETAAHQMSQDRGSAHSAAVEKKERMTPEHHPSRHKERDHHEGLDHHHKKHHRLSKREEYINKIREEAEERHKKEKQEIAQLEKDLGVDESMASELEKDEYKIALSIDEEKCLPKAEEGAPTPELGDLYPITPAVDLSDYIIHQENYDDMEIEESAAYFEDKMKDYTPADGSEFASRQLGSCAVVGNGGVLRMTEFGGAIDSHDTVLRLNAAPTIGYGRRVGLQTNYRVLNDFWSRSFEELGSLSKDQPFHYEDKLTIIATKTAAREFEFLVDNLKEKKHADNFEFFMMSPLLHHMGNSLEVGYRKKLCAAGFGPYLGLHEVSTGLATTLMAMQMCDSVTLYGFGVSEAMKHDMGDDEDEDDDDPDRRERDIERSKDEEYHYFTSIASQDHADEKHSFDTEEKLMDQLAAEGYLTRCTLIEDDDKNNWSCGCKYDNVDECKLPERSSYRDGDEDGDCGPGDCKEADDFKAAEQKKRDDERKEREDEEAHHHHGDRHGHHSRHHTEE